MRAFLGSLLLLAAACHHPGPGYRTSSVLEAVIVSAEVAACHPEMVKPRSDKEQSELEEKADADLGKQVVPEGLLGPDTFLRTHPHTHPTSPSINRTF